MKIIIVGCGKVGSTLAQQLNSEGHTITLIDTNSKVLENVSANYDVMGIVGNGASYTILKEAGVEEVDLLIAVTNSDELNLLCCLFAKKAGDCDTIARVRNPIYKHEVEFIKEELGLSMIINPEQTAALEISRILRFPSAINVETFAKGLVELMQVEIPEKSVLNNMLVSDISGKLGCNVLVCAVERGVEVIIPTGNYVLKTGDRISFVAESIRSMDFLKKSSISNNRVKSTMIVGGGTITYYLAKELIKSGIEVKIIEINSNRCIELSSLLPKATIINADGTDQDVLREEGIEFVESFVPLTNIDEQNVLLSLFARSISKAKLVTKINRIAFEEIVYNLNLGSIVHPKYLTADYILQYVRALQNSMGSNVETLYQIVGKKVEALAFNIRKSSPVIGIIIEELRLKENILLCCIIRDNKLIIPRGSDSIKEGDMVIVVTTVKGLKDIKDILLWN